ncbi:MAG TPA: hypothetical protein VHW95_07475 [Steroidobacteraceae bacterium]|jgi:hypothetical protein|nr:hypothetical protein [Steroidobacteraceae bacterium]
MSSVTADPGWRILVPFDRREGLPLKQAAAIAGRSESTIRTWCQRDGIGRRVAGGAWVVSQVAFQMLLDGDRAALRAYLDGVRTVEPVAGYYRRLGLELVLDEMKVSASRLT